MGPRKVTVKYVKMGMKFTSWDKKVILWHIYLEMIQNFSVI